MARRDKIHKDIHTNLCSNSTIKDLPVKQEGERAGRRERE